MVERQADGNYHLKVYTRNEKKVNLIEEARKQQDRSRSNFLLRAGVQRAKEVLDDEDTTSN